MKESGPLVGEDVAILLLSSCAIEREVQTLCRLCGSGVGGLRDGRDRAGDLGGGRGRRGNGGRSWRSIRGLEDGGRLLWFQGRAVGFHQLHLRKTRPHPSTERCVSVCCGCRRGCRPTSFKAIRSFSAEPVSGKTNVQLFGRFQAF